ncbi:hypothetical protein [Streptomyces sp. NPDC020597]|uniref:hypothetical protein n=1 Tax=unclassified Streptomyces TaxID=2593676 RepID=UPI0037BCBF4C
MKVDNVYLAGIGTCIPERVTIDEAVERGWYDAALRESAGMISVAVAGDTPAPDMAVSAARDALKHSRHDADDIDALIHTPVFHQGPDIWSAPHYILHHTVDRPVPALELRHGCLGMVTSLRFAANLLTADPRSTAVLVTAGDNFSTPNVDRWSVSDNYVLGDGGSAVVVSKRPGFARLLSVGSVSIPEAELLHRGGDPLFPPSVTLGKPLDLDARVAHLREQWAKGVVPPLFAEPAPHRRAAHRQLRVRVAAKVHAQGGESAVRRLQGERPPGGQQRRLADRLQQQGVRGHATGRQRHVHGQLSRARRGRAVQQDVAGVRASHVGRGDAADGRAPPVAGGVRRRGQRRHGALPVRAVHRRRQEHHARTPAAARHVVDARGDGELQDPGHAVDHLVGAHPQMQVQRGRRGPHPPGRDVVGAQVEAVEHADAGRGHAEVRVTDELARLADHLGRRAQIVVAAGPLAERPEPVGQLAGQDELLLDVRRRRDGMQPGPREVDEMTDGGRRPLPPCAGRALHTFPLLHGPCSHTMRRGCTVSATPGQPCPLTACCAAPTPPAGRARPRRAAPPAPR